MWKFYIKIYKFRKLIWLTLMLLLFYILIFKTDKKPNKYPYIVYLTTGETINCKQVILLTDGLYKLTTLGNKDTLIITTDVKKIEHLR